MLLVLVYVSQQIQYEFIRNVDSFVSGHAEMGAGEFYLRILFGQVIKLSFLKLLY
jgi:hypothetical protein